MSTIVPEGYQPKFGGEIVFFQLGDKGIDRILDGINIRLHA